MMKKLLATAALLASVAAPVGPAHADGHWTATDTARCAGRLVALPLLKAVSPLPQAAPAPACGEGSLIRHGG